MFETAGLGLGIEIAEALAMPWSPRLVSRSRVGWISMMVVPSMEVAGAAEIGVVDDDVIRRRFAIGPLAMIALMLL